MSMTEENPNWEKLTEEQREIVAKYQEISKKIREKGECVEYEGKEMVGWADNIDTFIGGILDEGKPHYFAMIQDLSSKIVDLCHVDLYDFDEGNRKGYEVLESQIFALEDKISEGVFPYEDDNYND